MQPIGTTSQSQTQADHQVTGRSKRGSRSSARPVPTNDDRKSKKGRSILQMRLTEKPDS